MTNVYSHRIISGGSPRRRLAFLVAAALAVTAVGGLSTPRSAWAWDPGASSGDSEARLVALHNQARASAGLRTLTLDPRLRTIARWRAKDLAERDYLSHTIKGTSRNVFWYMQYRYDYCFRVAGENLGTLRWDGAGEADASKWVFDAWMKSAGHRTNILGKAWDSIGVGAYRASDGTFKWTVLFADRCASSGGGPAPASNGSVSANANPRSTPRPIAEPMPRAFPRPAPRTPTVPETVTQLSPTQSPAPASPPTELPALTGDTDRPTPTPPPWHPSGGPSPVPVGDLQPSARPRPPGFGLGLPDHVADIGLAHSILMLVIRPLLGA